MDSAEARVALDADRVHRLLVEAGWTGPDPVILVSTTSTNAELEKLAAQGAPEGTCVVAEEQTAGRGRHDRVWHSPPFAGLWLSVLVRPGSMPTARWGWLPLLAGLAVCDAVKATGPLPIGLKWPNDLVVSNAACGGAKGVAKLGGLLSEVVADAVVIGIGMNVALDSGELPTPEATSLFAEGGSTDRDVLLAAILQGLSARLGQWRAGSEQLAHDYWDACVTIGRLVDVLLPGDQRIRGVVTGIDVDGHLLVDVDGVLRTVTAGDVIHATI